VLQIYTYFQTVLKKYKLFFKQMNTIQERILHYLDLKGITPYRFCKDLGFSMGYLDKKGAIGTDKYLKIIEYYEDVDANWLLTGKGEVLKPNMQETKPFEMVKQRVNLLEETKNKEKLTLSLNEPNSEYGIPLIPIDAMAGFGSGGVQVMDYDTQKYVVPEFTELNVDFMIRVKGSSMYPKYNSGDLVACKKLVLNDIFFQWNKVYVLDTDQGALIKRIKKGSDHHLLIVSDNPSYEPYELHLSKIHAIAIVLGVIRLE
jgi:phage repressor protein C with HTH and peptisase S24 domain